MQRTGDFYAEGTIPVILGGRFDGVVGHASFSKEVDTGRFDIQMSLNDEAGRLMIEFIEENHPIALSFFCQPIPPRSSEMTSSQNKQLTEPIPTPRLETGLEAGPYITKALNLVHDYVRARENLMETDPRIPVKTSIVWFCKTLQNWKALVITNLPDNKYYEVTYDGDNHRTYIDEYEKLNNVEIYD